MLKLHDFCNRALNGPAPRSRETPVRRSLPAKPDGERLTDAFLMSRLAELRPEGTIIVEEAPSSRETMQAHLPMLGKDSFFTGASGGLGYSLPAAVGVALARPREKVVALIGDGSAMYSIQALWTACQLKLPISFIIVNNRRYEALVQFGKLFELAPVGTDLPGLDFCGFAAGSGIAGKRITDPAHVDEALIASLSSAEPNLVEFIVA